MTYPNCSIIANSTCNSLHLSDTHSNDKQLFFCSSRQNLRDYRDKYRLWIWLYKRVALGYLIRRALVCYSDVRTRS